MKFLTRQAFALLGALTLISLLGDIVTLHETVSNIVDAIRSVTRPFWGLILGWLPFDLPVWFADYLTVGTIIAGMTVRMRFYRWQLLKSGHVPHMSYRVLIFRFFSIKPHHWFQFHFLDLPIRFFDNLFLWPIAIAYMFVRYIALVSSRRPRDQKALFLRAYIIYLETLVWALIILTANYSLIFGWQ